ncbi:MAG: hypothetical protein ACQETI_04540 [Halobacteriota archaeon]
MVSVVNLVLFVVVLGIHTLVAAVMTRFFRLRLETQWGWVVYSVTLIPVVLLVTTLVFTGVLGIGIDLGNPAAAVAVMIGLPLALGVTIDVLYVPPPEEYELPETARET